MSDALLYTGAIAAGVVGAWLLLHLFWRVVGAYRIRRAGPPPLAVARHVLWRPPAPIEQLDPVAGPGGRGGAPSPPFHFLEEHGSGTKPCVSVRDAKGRRWRVKWGDEVRAESFAVRFAWSCGYFAEETHFIATGAIEGAHDLQRATACIGQGGDFCDARFELDDPAIKKLFEEHSWAWHDNPFVGTRELTGLKLVVMLLSNWDTKDRRDVARGSNTAIFEHPIDNGRREARYLLSDWGGAMGRWGSTAATRGNWDVGAFEEQTPQFVVGVARGLVEFGYTGQRTADIAGQISIDDVRWFHSVAGRLDQAYLRRALQASGATDDEAGRFATALVERIGQLGRVSLRVEKSA